MQPSTFCDNVTHEGKQNMGCIVIAFVILMMQLHCCKTYLLCPTLTPSSSHIHATIGDAGLSIHGNLHDRNQY